MLNICESSIDGPFCIAALDYQTVISIVQGPPLQQSTSSTQALAPPVTRGWSSLNIQWRTKNKPGNGSSSKLQLIEIETSNRIEIQHHHTFEGHMIFKPEPLPSGKQT